MKSILIMLAMAGAVACRSTSTSAPAPVTPAPVGPASGAAATTTRDVMVRIGGVESFRPQTGAAAVRAFVPEISADETGGECQLLRTGGSGATVVIASYPTRATAKMQVNITFDSAGRLVRYSERRGVVHFQTTPGMAPAQVDSVLRAAEAATRSTTISMDYAVDQATAMNRGGGKPTDAVMGTVRLVESLPSLGPPQARLDRVRKLCGV